jgi:argininosuccinate lyase
VAADTPGRSLGGRFTEPTDALLERLNRSVDTDRRLWKHDIDGSQAHAAMLAAVGLLSADDARQVHDGLEAVREELATDSFVFLPSDEDVHMAVERRLVELVGEPGRRLHTGRSRNDQVMLDTVLWLREAAGALRADLIALCAVLLDRAEGATRVVMPSFTHLQPAQVSSVGQWLCAHAAELQRHVRRLDHLAERLDECPLGSGASAGSYLPLDRQMTAAALGFAGPTVNSVQSTGSRADLLDALGLLAGVGVSLSRLGEELVLLASPAYGWLRLPDGLTTGSSLLPQKRNPDGAELLRAGGKLPALEFAALASVSSGLVSGYSKDLQHDKELLFRSWDRVTDLLALATRHLSRVVFNEVKMRAACTPDLAALWLADRLVLAGLPFREAHRVVGGVARASAEQGVGLSEALAARCVAEGEPVAGALAIAEALASVTVDQLLEQLQTEGSAAPERVAVQVATLRARLGLAG